MGSWLHEVVALAYLLSNLSSHLWNQLVSVEAMRPSLNDHVLSRVVACQDHYSLSNEPKDIQHFSRDDSKVPGLTLDGGIDTGSYAKFDIRCSCNLDFCSVMARFLICSWASGERSSLSVFACVSGPRDCNGSIFSSSSAKRTLDSFAFPDSFAVCFASSVSDVRQFAFRCPRSLTHFRSFCSHLLETRLRIISRSSWQWNGWVRRADRRCAHRQCMLREDRIPCRRRDCWQEALSLEG